MFDKILIANRGEIACRVIKTARALGVRTVAVYSDADAGALHVALADEACRIGPAPAAESYLSSDAVIAAARRTAARAIHPGYGFLAENAAFAEACAAAGLVFVGPPSGAIRAMGSKIAAKQIMHTAEVAVIPGYHGEDQSRDRLRAEAETIGYPLIIKAAAGGGGKGMRIVTRRDELDAALEAAAREASAAFGDSSVLLERYLARPRHIEVQIFGDTFGNFVHLFERDCSVQRRHQKVIEEAPAAGLDPATRAAMTGAAIAAARAIGYTGAGTVEFLLDRDGRFYFMEMNTRLQVEHPVTELVTGRDLVEWQLRVAAGEELPCGQDALEVQGHAVEARLYAENPRQQFLPAAGRLRHLRFPRDDALVRVDTGVRQGDTIGVDYDPMIAKIIAWGENRDQALSRLAAALAHTEIAGPSTNLEYLAGVIRHPAFELGEVDTSFAVQFGAGLLAAEAPLPPAALAVAALELLLGRGEEAARAAARGLDPNSPWHRTDGWRLNEEPEETLCFAAGGRKHNLAVRPGAGGYLVTGPDGTSTVRGERDGAGGITATVDGVRHRASVVRDGDTITVFVQGRGHELTHLDPRRRTASAEAGAGSLVSPMPGKVVAVLVEPGETVEPGAPLMILEAMKMEHTIVAPAAGVVERIRFGPGDTVDEAVELVVLASPPPG